MIFGASQVSTNLLGRGDPRNVGIDLIHSVNLAQATSKAVFQVQKAQSLRRLITCKPTQIRSENLSLASIVFLVPTDMDDRILEPTCVSFFEVNRNHIAFTALRSLAEESQLSKDDLVNAVEKLGIDTTKEDPLTAN